MEKGRMKIAAVVVTYNRLELLKLCINGLLNQTKSLDEIIVVNNSSTDGTFEWLKEQNYLTVITQENSGSAGGQYTGIKTAYEKGYDWIWCMDDDSEAELNSLEKLLYYTNGHNLVIAPKVVDENNNILFEHRGNFNFNRIIKGDLQTPSVLKDYKENYFEVDFASFVGIFINRAVISKIGFPRKEFFIYHDDVEYCLRIKSVSKVGVVSDSVIKHKISPKKDYIIKKKLIWISFRPILARYGIKCICYRNLFYLYRYYYPNKYLGLLTVLYNYVVLIRRIILFDENKLYMINNLNIAVTDAIKSNFNNEYYLGLTKK